MIRREENERWAARLTSCYETRPPQKSTDLWFQILALDDSGRGAWCLGGLGIWGKGLGEGGFGGVDVWGVCFNTNLLLESLLYKTVWLPVSLSYEKIWLVVGLFLLLLLSKGSLSTGGVINSRQWLARSHTCCHWLPWWYIS